MRFGRSGEGGFTYGYTGHGPGNLQEAIVRFLEATFGHPLPERTVELLRAAIHAADQNEPLVIPRSLLGAATSPLRAV